MFFFYVICRQEKQNTKKETIIIKKLISKNTEYSKKALEIQSIRAAFQAKNLKYISGRVKISQNKIEI